MYVTDGNHTKSTTWTVQLDELEILNLTNLTQNGTIAVVEFVVHNRLTTPVNQTWSYDPNSTGIIWAGEQTTLSASEDLMVILEHNFTATGTYTTIASANTSVGTYTAALNLTLP